MKKRIFIWMILWFCASCAGPRSSAMRQAMTDDLKEAKRLLSSGYFRQAVEELSLLLELDPKNEEALFLKAYAFQQLEEFEKAARDYEILLTHRPDLSKARYNLGMIYAYKLGEIRQALEHFDYFLSLAPEHEKSFQVVKIMCALEATRAAGLSEDSDLSPKPYLLAAQNFEKEGKTEEAIRSYQTALERSPTCAPCHQGLGQLLMARKKTKEGENHLLKAKLFDPNSSSFLN